jgi:4-hydroxybenzoate polyprenyltransferase
MSSRRYPRWFLPAFSLLLGFGSLTAFWVGGNLHDGLFALAVLAGVGLVFLVGGRSETIRGLRGDARDEYWAGLDRDASLIAGLVAIGLLIVLCLWEWAHGRDGSPYSQVAAVSGVAYIVSFVALRLRR